MAHDGEQQVRRCTCTCTCTTVCACSMAAFQRRRRPSAQGGPAAGGPAPLTLGSETSRAYSSNSFMNSGSLNAFSNLLTSCGKWPQTFGRMQGSRQEACGGPVGMGVPGSNMLCCMATPPPTSPACVTACQPRHELGRLLRPTAGWGQRAVDCGHPSATCGPRVWTLTEPSQGSRQPTAPRMRGSGP